MNDFEIMRTVRDMPVQEMRKKLWEIGNDAVAGISDSAMAVCYSRGACEELGIDYCDIRRNDVLRAMVYVAYCKGICHD